LDRVQASAAPIFRLGKRHEAARTRAFAKRDHESKGQTGEIDSKKHEAEDMMRTLGLIVCAYLLIGLFISMLMDRFKRLQIRIFVLGVLMWPLAFPLAVNSGIRELRRRRRS
jgi:hypothetical protein